MVTYKFRHDHPCSLRGVEVEVRPPIRDGCEYLVMPRCIETGTELVMVGRTVFGQN